MNSLQTRLSPESLTVAQLAILRRRTIAFAVGVLSLVAVFHGAFASWLHFSRTYDHYSHIILIPFISAYLVVSERQQIFRNARPAIGSGVLVGMSGIALVAAAHLYRPVLNEEDFVMIAMTGLVILVIAGFVAFWGKKSAWAAAFPLGFLFLAVPLPLFVIDHVIEALRRGSASLSYTMFQLLGTPVLRHGYVIELPHLSIEVAKECSGIRSSIAMFVLVLLCGHWYLKSNVRRIVLLLVTVPLLIFKNSVRIVVLTLLSEYVDPGFLSGRLHRDGGIVFFATTFAIVALIIEVLRRTESPSLNSGPANRAGSIA